MSMRSSRWPDASAPVQRWPDLLRTVCNGSGGAVVDVNAREADRDDAVNDDVGVTSALETALTVAMRSRDGAAIARRRRAASTPRARWKTALSRDADASGPRHIDATR